MNGLKYLRCLLTVEREVVCTTAQPAGHLSFGCSRSLLNIDQIKLDM